MKVLRELLKALGGSPLQSDGEAWALLGESEALQGRSCTHLWGDVEGYQQIRRDASLSVEMGPQSRKGRLFVLPFAPVRRGLGALKLERNP